MTSPTPLALPARPYIAGQDFNLRPLVDANPIAGGGYQGASFGESVWYCSLQTAPLGHASAGSYKWLMANRRGALRGIYVFDASRADPLAYDGVDFAHAPTADSSLITCDSTAYTCDMFGPGVVAPWGSPRITAVNASAGTIDLTGFRPGAIISEGDYGHWDDGRKRRLQICGSATADASGNIAGLRVEPLPPATLLATLPVPFVMHKASAEMLILNSSVQFQAPVTSQAQLEAVQVLRSA